jgi:phenylalanyl-tRNA synthetase alpha chain
MDIKQTARNLHQLEVKVVKKYRPGETISAGRLEVELGYKTGQANQAFSWLLAKGLLSEASRSTKAVFELTPLGKEFAEKGTPEERILRKLAEAGPLSMGEAAASLGLEQKDVGSAYGVLSKEGAISMNAEKKIAVNAAWFEAGHSGGVKPRIAVVRGLLEKAAAAGGLLEESDLDEAEKAVIAGIAKKRGAGDSPFRVAEREVILYALTPQARDVAAELDASGITGEELGTVSQEILERGAWRGANFRPYNIGLPPARLIVGRKNPYGEFLSGVKDKLASLGFEEFDGGLVETEFWNSDALFMPQFHAARDIHDVYHLKSPTKAREIEEPYLSRVAAAHEDGGETGSRGWRYPFDRDFTKRLILRSQGTVLSARTLPKAKVPGKYFGIVRCFRYDKVDATHLSDFYQTEGIVLGEEVNLRTLLGFLEMFAVEVAGAKEVKYVPGYFPFTEPSVEVHIKHPVLGWFELGGSGIFRPEVTEPLGVKVPVLAWGIGIDRMALMALGLNDLRELFSPDIENVRLRRVTASM